MDTVEIINTEALPKENISLFRNAIYKTGLAAMLLSLAIFCLPFFRFNNGQNDNGLFLINYVIAAFYFFTIWFSGSLRKRNGGLHFFILFLILFLISAYSLNREMNVFEDSTNWLCALLIICCVNYITFTCLDTLPKFIHSITGFILGISLCIFSYLSVYLFPLYIFSAVLSFLLGFTLHTFVPLLFVIFTLKLAKRTGKRYKSIFNNFITGIVFSLLVTAIFCTRWVSTNNSLSNSYQQTGKNAAIPAWVYAAQNIKLNSFTEKVLKAGILYTVPGNWNDIGFFHFGAPMISGEKTQHDPLIMTAAFFSTKTAIEPADRVNMLKVLADKRHATQERLWRGDDLETKHIKTIAQVWPSLHLAYTEKTVTIINKNPVNGNRQEAIYTFSLPEGSVVTALSLWINGKEEKSILTTKVKADNAYKTIVGVEQRDPSVLHWEEGNTVSVRIFPVLPGEERTFKIGITSPLPVTGGQLVYNNIVFQGPATNSTNEDVEVTLEESAKSLITVTSLQANNNRKYMHTGQYNPSWSLAWKAENVQPAAFCFNGNSYVMQQYIPQKIFTPIQFIYLDINETWTLEEITEIYKAANGRPVYVYNNGFKKLTSTNMDDLVEELHRQHFSLFPFYQVHDVTGSLVVTKCSEISARLNDLKDSPFFSLIKEFATNKKIKLFNIGNGLSAYLSSLREMRVFDYEQGTIADLSELVRDQHFAKDMENDNCVVLHDAKLTITKSAGATASTAPDHLMRLFAYNHIMQRGGAKFMDGNIPEDDTLVQEAKIANIVTPVSSMVVLESQKDYNRFGIQATPNSLQNASTGSKGSVPEPHEWALIILTLLTVLYLKTGNRFQVAFSKKK